MNAVFPAEEREWKGEKKQERETESKRIAERKREKEKERNTEKRRQLSACCKALSSVCVAVVFLPLQTVAAAEHSGS